MIYLCWNFHDDEPLSEAERESYATQSRLLNFYSKAAWGALIAAFMMYGPQSFGGACTAATFFMVDQHFSIKSTVNLPLSQPKKIAAITSYLTASALLIAGLLSFKNNAATAGAVCSIIGCAIPTLFLGIRHHLELQPIISISERTPLTRAATAPAGAVAVRVPPAKQAFVIGTAVIEGALPPRPSAPSAPADEDPRELEQLPGAEEANLSGRKLSV